MNFERRAKLSTAVTSVNYSIICICETWLNNQIESSELMLHDYNIYRSNRERVNDTNKHGGSLIAVKNTFACEKLTVDLRDSCVSCKIDISGQ